MKRRISVVFQISLKSLPCKPLVQVRQLGLFEKSSSMETSIVRSVHWFSLMVSSKMLAKGSSAPLWTNLFLSAYVFAVLLTCLILP